MGTAVNEAAQAAERWATKVGVEIDVVDHERGARDVVSVLAAVWPQDNGVAPMTPELAWALAHSGNYVALARSEEGPVAAAVGFRSVDGEGAYLHSHIAGVLPGRQGGSVGFALKQHQRAWTLAQGLPRITWTFDPLIARNAYFNVMKLGARITRYYVDFYGSLTDGINVGDETDRCLVTWWLGDARSVTAAAGGIEDCSPAELRAAGAVEVLGADEKGGPVLTEAPEASSVRIVRLPADVVDMRRRDPDLARRWRQALRQVLVAAFEEGLEVSAVSRDGCYVLSV